jgi:hypothetical protein
VADPKPPPPLKPALAKPWRRTLLVLNEIAAHLVMIIGLLAAIKLLEILVQNLGKSVVFFKGSPYFEFDSQWFFDAADLILLFALLVLGVFLVIKTAFTGDKGE